MTGLCIKLAALLLAAFSAARGQMQECPPLPPIANGFITYAPDNMPNYELGTVATYACNAGFALDFSNGGSEMRTCVDDGGMGVFTDQAPLCTPQLAIQCPLLSTPSNGSIEYFPATQASPSLGTVAIYQCDEGFYLSTEERARTCVDDNNGDAVGVFSGEGPTCNLADSVFCFRRVGDLFCGGAFLDQTDGATCCLETDSGGLGGGGYAVTGVNRCIVCDKEVIVEFEPPSYMVGEGGVVSFRVVLTGEIDVPVVIAFSTEDVSAAAPDDYTGLQATLTFEPGDSERVVSVQTVNDEVPENDEFFVGRLDIVSAQTTVSLGTSQASVIVFDDDAMCSDLPSLVNGVVEYQPDTVPRLVGTVANFSCNAGYLLNGPVNAECVVINSTAVFDPAPPMCDALCDQLPAPNANGGISYSTEPPYSEGAVATYSCNEGYELTGPGNEMRTCRDNGDGSGGDFDGTAPTCEPVCDQLPDIANGMISYASDMVAPYSVSTVATYSCNEGYILRMGDEMRTCRDNGDGSGGDFDGTAPTCEPQCPPLPPISNGIISYGPDTTPDYDVGTVATYVCDEGIFLIGDLTRECQSDRTFSGASPVCSIQIFCSDLPTLANAVISYSGGVIDARPVDTEASYQCEDGFNLVGESTRTCQEDRMFDGLEPFCTPLCSDLPELVNGMIDYSTDNPAPYPIGTVATHSCNDGYAIHGPENRTCEGMGSGGSSSAAFNLQAPVCDPVCDEIPEPPLIIITYPTDPNPQFPEGTVAVATCREGFSPGTTGREPTTTIELFCFEVLPGGGGVFVIPGTATNALSCEPTCNELPVISNGAISYSPDMEAPYNLGTVATYVCIAGYELVGDMTRNCVNSSSGGMFDGSEPFCRPGCAELPPITNGMISYATDMTPLFEVGTVATYTCNDGFSFVEGEGNQMRTCAESDMMEAGQPTFDGTAPRCERVLVCELPTYLVANECAEQCPPGFLGNHETRACEILPDDFEVLTNATAYFLSLDTDTPPGTNVLNYTVLVNQDLIGDPQTITLELTGDMRESFGFDNGQAFKAYSSLPSSYFVDDRNIGSFEERIFTRGEIPLSDSTAQSALELDVVVLGSNGEESSTNVSLFVTVSEPGMMVGLEVSALTVSEGNRVAIIPILKEITPNDIIVTVVIESITAEAGVDYGPFAVPVLRLPAFLPANQTRVEFGVPVFDDQLVEHTETFRVELESPDSQVTIGGVASTLVSIEDNDVVEFILSLRDGSPVVTEGNQQLVFNLTKVGMTARDVSIVFRTENGSAREPGDFRAVTLPLTFEPNDVTMDVVVSINQDNVVEGPEMFSVTFDPAPGETGVGPISERPVVMILDDSDVVTVSLDLSLVEVREGSVRRVVVQSSGNNEIPVTVALEFSNDSSAIEGEDYFLNISTLTFEPGVRSLAIPVTAISDGLFEGDDESLILIGRPGEGETRVLVDPEADEVIVSIEDTDSVSVGFASSELTVSESSPLLNITVLLVEGQLAADVVVTVTAASSLAVSGEDFDFPPVDLTFEPGGLRSLVAGGIIRDDDVFEGREGFSLSLMSANDRVIFSPPTQQVLIVDNEDLVISFSSNVYSVAETDPSLEVRVQLGEGIRLQREITLDLRSSDGDPPTGATSGLDFEAVDTVLTFGPGVTMATHTVILLDDEISEGLEDFTLDIVLVNEALGEPGVLETATVAIFDNEDILVSLSSAEYRADEGMRLAVIVIDKSGITPNNEDTIVRVTLTDGTAQGGVDYGPFPIALPFSQLTAVLPANDTQTLFGIPISNDNLVEGEESFFVAIELIGGRSQEEGGIVFLGNITMATVLIEDNDRINISLVANGSNGGVVNVGEGLFQLEFSAVRNDGVSLARDVSVVARTTAGTAEEEDFVPAEMELAFLSGTDETQTLTFSIMLLDDAVAEGDESLTVELMAIDDNVVLSTSSVQVNIQDNDVALVEFVSSVYESFELERSVQICLRKSAETAFSFTATVIPMETSDVEEDVFAARANVDFDATPRNVTFGPTDNQTCTSIAVFQDGMPGEGLEVFSLGLASLAHQAAVERGSLATAEVFINDVPDVIFGFQSSTPVRVGEGVGAVELCVGVFNPAPDELLNTTLTLTIETLPGTADEMDFSPITSLSITLNDTRRSDCFQVRIIDDDIFEDPATEVFSVTISSFLSSNSDFRVLRSPANVTIAINDDDRSVTVGFTETLYQVLENQTSFEVCVAVTIPPLMEMFTNDEISLLVTTVAGTASESDYLAFSDRLVGSVSNTNREVCFTVEIVDDEIIEEQQETFSLTLSLQVPEGLDLSVSLDPSVARVIIINDDFPVVTSTPTLPTSTLTVPTPTLTVPTPTPSQTISVSISSSIATPTPTPVPQGNDTIVGDPLFSVPLNLVEGSQLVQLTTLLHLCYEIHGMPDTYLNLVSDACTNINAYYSGLVPDTPVSLGLNIITRIGVRARDLRGNCVHVSVDAANNCTPVVMTARGGVVSEMRYDRDGVVVSKVRNRARISVPNCGRNRLVMWITCEARGMLRFDLTRGIGLTPTSHGLLGQFWNVPITISKYTYSGEDEIYLDPEQLYTVTVSHPTTGSTRRFIAEYDEQVWDRSNKDCLYAGNVQGGRLGDIIDPSVSDPVVEGRYTQYIVSGLFEDSFLYSQFEGGQCV